MRTDAVPILDLPLDPRERGRAHGEGFRSRIESKLALWRDAIGSLHGRHPDEFLETFLAQTDFRPAIERWTPELLEEITGIAEGAAQSEHLTYAMQLMDEEWWFAEQAHEHCTSVALLSDGAARPTRAGQTMDLPRWFDGTQAVLRLKDLEGAEVAVVTSVGMVALMGVAARGISVCTNSLRRLSNQNIGLPVAFVVRRLLASSSHDDAVKIAQEIDHATAQSYLITSPCQSTVVECSARKVVRTAAREAPDRVFHTNHPFENDDFSGPARSHSLLDSYRRLDRIRARLGVLVDSVGLAEIQAALASQDDERHPISKAPKSNTPLNASRTFAAVIYEFGEGVSINFCGGPPSEEGWIKLDLKPFDSPGSTT